MPDQQTDDHVTACQISYYLLVTADDAMYAHLMNYLKMQRSQVCIFFFEASVDSPFIKRSPSFYLKNVISVCPCMFDSPLTPTS